MSGVMERLRKLLAMAESPVVEEARTAALMAAKLIKEHRIALLLPDDTRLIVTTPKPVQRYDQPIKMRARTHGLCMACGGTYFMDEPVLVWSGRTTHQMCASYWSE